MDDHIFASFLEVQEAEAADLASQSDLFDLIPVGTRPYQKFLVRYFCRGLVRTTTGVEEGNRWELGIYMTNEYLRRVNPSQVLTWLGPANSFHPNILAPYVCAGRITPGTSLVELIYQCFEIVTYQKVTMREDDALNPEACRWARNNLDRIPIDDRPIVRRSSGHRIRVKKLAEGEQ